MSDYGDSAFKPLVLSVISKLSKVSFGFISHPLEDRSSELLTEVEENLHNSLVKDASVAITASLFLNCDSIDLRLGLFLPKQRVPIDHSDYEVKWGTHKVLALDLCDGLFEV